jgi:hypothetical protein
MPFKTLFSTVGMNILGIGVIKIHVREKKDEMFFNKETYNKCIPVDSKAFHEFIHQIIFQIFVVMNY